MTATPPPRHLPERLPEPGELVQVRTPHWLVEEVTPRWPDAVRDEMLARLLELAAQRAAEEARAGTATTAPKEPYRSSRLASSHGPRTSRAAEARPLWEAPDD